MKRQTLAIVLDGKADSYSNRMIFQRFAGDFSSNKITTRGGRKNVTFLFKRKIIRFDSIRVEGTANNRRPSVNSISLDRSRLFRSLVMKIL